MQFMEFAHHTLTFSLLHCFHCSLFHTHTHVCSPLPSTLRHLLLHVVYVSDKRGSVEPTPRDQSPQSAHLSPGNHHRANLSQRQPIDSGKTCRHGKTVSWGPHPWLIHYYPLLFDFLSAMFESEIICMHVYLKTSIAESSCSGYICEQMFVLLLIHLLSILTFKCFCVFLQSV